MASFKSDGKMIFMIFVGAIITIVFLGVIADSVFTQTNTISVVNETITTAAVNSSVTLTGRANTTAITVVNASSDVDWSTNFSVSTISNGVLGIFLVTSDNAGTAGQNVTSANVSYSAEPQGYLQASSDRSVANLITIIAALAIVVFVIVVMIKFGSFGNLMRNFR